MIPIKLYREEIADGKRKTVEIADHRCDTQRGHERYT